MRVFSGRDGSELFATTPGYGAAIAPAGDLNGDGTPDLLATDPRYQNSHGEEVGRISGLSGLTVLVQALAAPSFGGRNKDACWTNHAVIAIQ